MPDKPKGLSHFWKEVKRRNVLRSLAIYAGTAFLILEASVSEFINEIELLTGDFSVDLGQLYSMIGGPAKDSLLLIMNLPLSKE